MQTVAWLGPEGLHDLNIASGVLTVANKRNRYAVNDRFETAGRLLRALTWPAVQRRVPVQVGSAGIPARAPGRESFD
jgi:hypothetical protein